MGKVALKISLAVLALWSSHGNAQSVLLQNGGSSANIDMGSSAGMNSWSVLGQNQLNQQWFWYSVGGGIAQPINSISAANFSTSGLNYLTVTYANAQLSINVQYTLSGLGAGSADMTETINVVNNSTNSFNLKLFEYSNFNLLGEANDTVNIYPDTLPGSSGYNYVQQDNGAGTAISEGITSPDANFAEAGFVTSNPNTLDNISTVSGYDLNNQLTAGAGDVTWAFEWDPTVDAGQDFQVFKDKSLSIQMVPEPTTMALIGLGLGVCGFARAWKRNS